jgi:hypothetical protein
MSTSWQQMQRCSVLLHLESAAHAWGVLMWRAAPCQDNCPMFPCGSCRVCINAEFFCVLLLW